MCSSRFLAVSWPKTGPLSQECDCCWLLFFRELLPAMLRQLLAAPREARRLPHLLAAFVDGGRLLAHAASPTESQLEVHLAQLIPVPAADHAFDTLDPNAEVSMKVVKLRDKLQ